VCHLLNNLRRLTLQAKLVLLVSTGAAVMMLGILIAVAPAAFASGPLSAEDAVALRWRVVFAAAVCGLAWLAASAVAISFLLTPIQQTKASEAARTQFDAELHERTQSVHQLLEFSLLVQGAGTADQVFAALGHYLYKELKLAGVAIMAFEGDAIPSASTKFATPEGLLRPERPFHDADVALCPALRQMLPRVYTANSPVRCSIDECITLGKEHSAYSIPFSIGRKVQIVCHLLLPVGDAWNDDLKQLAQTYVNAAATTLINLNLLAEAERQSMTDALTGLYNRRSMDNLMQREVALAERHGNPLTLVMIDMDKFKQINDTHGHAAGDYLLKAFASCVQMTLRKTDLAFRYGGDEFCIALPQTSSTMAQQVVAKLRTAFGAVDFSSAIANLENAPTLSVGLAERSKQHNVLTFQNLIAAADLALYDAKAANRNCVKVYTPPQAA
jgi:diguanylate cyclase (GGDEF)-like protein